MIGQREPRILCPGFLRFVRAQRCCIPGCSRGPVEAAHIRIGLTGMQRKPDDRKATPLCAGHHRTDPDAQHNQGESRFWAGHRLNPFKIAEALYAAYIAAGGKPGAPAKRRTAAVKRKAPADKRRQSFVNRSRRKWPSRPFPPSRGFS